MKTLTRRLLALVLALMLCVGGAGAYSSVFVNTYFDLLLWQIEDNSLFTEDREMSDEERAEINALLEEHPEDLERIVNEYLATLDTHSMYVTANEYEEGFSTLVGYVGIGVGVTMSPQGVILSEVFRSGPAREAGMQVGDRITAIDGADVTAFDTTQIANLMRGEAGTSVTVTVDRDGETLSFTLTRREIHQDYVSSKTVAPGVEYISIDAMGSMEDLETFREIWDGLDEKDTRAVILDLRSNGGGLIDAAYGIADIILEKKGTYMGAERWRSDMGGLKKHYATGGGLPLNKLCVLVDQNTASAAELLTAVLKEAGGAEVIGTTTYGKGQGQSHMSFADGSRLIVTTLEMLDPNGDCWEGKGITPTLEITEDQTVDSFLDSLPALETGARIWYGEQSERVRALSGRLFLLDYSMSQSDVFDTELLSAVRRFRRDEMGCAPTLYADDKLIEAVNEKVSEITGGDYVLDTVYYTALALCREAAAQPARYIARADGTWRAAA